MPSISANGTPLPPITGASIGCSRRSCSGATSGRNDAALIDTWFLDEGQAAGVESVSGYNVTLDTDIPLPAGAHAVFRNEQGREWGPVAVTTTGDPDTIRVNTSDAAVVEQWTGQPFYQLFQKARRKLPVTVLIGTLAELTQPYLIRTVRPDANGTAQISAVIDADEVWHVLGEEPAPEPPITEVIRNEGDLLPILPWVRAQAVQKATALMLDWAVAPTRGATNYVVEIRYEDEDAGEAWETIHNGPATEGLYPLDYRAGVTVRVRARAFNPNGVPSEPKYTVVTLFKPVITPDIADMLIELEMLQGQVRKDIESITKLGRDTLRGALKDLADRVEELANATATEAGNSYESRELVKVAVGNAFAAIKRETEIRIEENLALARTVETMVANLGDISEAGLTEERQVRASTDEALSQQITTLRADLGTSAASFTSQLEARTGPDSALAQQLNVLSSSVGGQSVTLTQYGAAINGVRAEYGVAVEADGSCGRWLPSLRDQEARWHMVVAVRHQRRSGGDGDDFRHQAAGCQHHHRLGADRHWHHHQCPHRQCADHQCEDRQRRDRPSEGRPGSTDTVRGLGWQCISERLQLRRLVPCRRQGSRPCLVQWRFEHQCE